MTDEMKLRKRAKEEFASVLCGYDSFVIIKGKLHLQTKIERILCAILY